MSNRKTYRKLFRRVLTGGVGLPSEGLIGKWLVQNNLVDSIGESSILFQSGDAATWQTTAVWGFERTAATITIDTALGGDILFVGEAPKYWTWAQWVTYPGINATVLFIGRDGIAGYSTSQAAKASSIIRYLDYTEPEIDYYVDSTIPVGGDGLTADTPIKTIAALLALSPAAGSVIGLKSGSSWQEQFVFPANNITLKSYGTGDYPLLDASDLIAPESFSKTVGRTNVYEVSLAVETSAVAAEYPSVWVNNTRLTKAADLATCDTTPGTYYHASPTDVTPITIYVHAPGSTDPTSDGKTYEASVRGSGATCYARTGCIIKGVRGRRNYSSYGSITVGVGCLAVDCKADDGNTHNLFVRPSGRAVNCSALNFYDSATAPIPYIFYENSPSATHEMPFHNCSLDADAYTSANGYYCHTTSGEFASVTYKSCGSNNVSTPYSFANTSLGNVSGGTITNFLIILNSTSPVTCKGITGSAARASAHWGNLGVGCTSAVIEDNNVVFDTSGHLRVLGNNKTFVLRDNTITGPNTVLLQSSAYTGVSVTITGNTFIPNGKMSVIYNVTGEITLASDNNAFGGATGKWTYNGADYLNLAAWQVTGRDLNSTNVA